MRLSRLLLGVAPCAALLMLGTTAYAGDDKGEKDDLAPTGRGIGTIFHPGDAGDHKGPSRIGSSSPLSGNGIFYHGGPVLPGSVNIHYIWYGDWSNNTATTILSDLASHIGGSPYFHINTTYHDNSGNQVSGLCAFAGSTFATSGTNYSKSLSDSDIQSVVAAQNPTDTNGVYFVLTSADVNESSGFCTQYCGWHSRATINGHDIKYAFVGNPDRCPSACEAQSTSPNGNAGADGMASIISHELEEATTDPDLNAWFDRRGQENADKCAWTFGQVTLSNGAYYNMTLGSRNYLIQQNWVNASGGYCALKY